MSEALGIIFAVAGLIWVGFMLRAMFGLISLAPKGQRMEVYNRLSMWNFGAVRTTVGPGAEPHLLAMKRGAYIFIALFLAVLAFALVSLVFRQEPATHIGAVAHATIAPPHSAEVAMATAAKTIDRALSRLEN